MNDKPPPQGTSPDSVDSFESGTESTLWLTYSFAPEWYSDAESQAAISDHKARRREILFAVTAAESYLVEWVRDSVLNREVEKLKTYFPAGSKRGVSQKYKDVTKQLAADGRIVAPLGCGGTEWLDFKKLVSYRDGLVHASASRPETTGLPDSEMPVPSKSDLDAYPAGQALQIVRTLFQKLHADTNTPVPEWLQHG